MSQIGNTTVLPSMTLGTPLAEASGGTGVSTVLVATKTALNASGSAPVYACRAWVNFNGTGTVAIRASGNVSSITDNGVGLYTINFATAMPDANYSVTGITSGYTAGASGRILLINGSDGGGAAIKSTTQLQMWAGDVAVTAIDMAEINVQIFR